VSSIEPDDGSCHVNGTKKRFCQLVIARGDRSILLELGKEILNQMPRFVQLLVVFTRVLAVALRRNHTAFALLLESLNHPLVRIISFVGSHRIGLNVLPQHTKSYSWDTATLQGMNGFEGHQLKPLQQDWEANAIAQSLDASKDGRVYFIPAYLCLGLPGSIGTELYLEKLKALLLLNEQLNEQ